LKEHNSIIKITLEHYPNTQAIYLFGSYGTDQKGSGSDVDIAVLLPPVVSRNLDSLILSNTQVALEALLKRDVDLINLRKAPTVLQKEVIQSDRRIYAGDEYAAEEFEMLTLSFYQKLNEERAEIISDALSGGRFYQL